METTAATILINSFPKIKHHIKHNDTQAKAFSRRTRGDKVAAEMREEVLSGHSSLSVYANNNISTFYGTNILSLMILLMHERELMKDKKSSGFVCLLVMNHSCICLV